MIWNFLFFLNSSLLGVGLAMDAFSISLANGLHEPSMKNSRMLCISGVYAVFQFIMPMTGWFLVRRAAAYFSKLEAFFPWISLILLTYIGGKMIVESIQERKAIKAEAGAKRGPDDEKNQPDVQRQAEDGSRMDIERQADDESRMDADRQVDDESLMDADRQVDDESLMDAKKITVSALLLQGIATSIDALSVGFTIADYPWFQALVCSLIIGLITWLICFVGLILGKKIGTHIGNYASIAGGILLIGIGIEIFVSHIMG